METRNENGNGNGHGPHLFLRLIHLFTFLDFEAMNGFMDIYLHRGWWKREVMNDPQALDHLYRKTRKEKKIRNVYFMFISLISIH